MQLTGSSWEFGYVDRNEFSLWHFVLHKHQQVELAQATHSAATASMAFKLSDSFCLLQAPQSLKKTVKVAVVPEL